MKTIKITFAMTLLFTSLSGYAGGNESKEETTAANAFALWKQASEAAKATSASGPCTRDGAIKKGLDSNDKDFQILLTNLSEYPQELLKTMTYKRFAEIATPDDLKRQVARPPYLLRKMMESGLVTVLDKEREHSFAKPWNTKASARPSNFAEISFTEKFFAENRDALHFAVSSVLSEEEFNKQMEANGRVFHGLSYKQEFELATTHPNCDVCNQLIPIGQGFSKGGVSRVHRDSCIKCDVCGETVGWLDTASTGAIGDYKYGHAGCLFKQ